MAMGGDGMRGFGFGFDADTVKGPGFPACERRVPSVD